MPGKMGDDDEFLELECHGYDLRTERREVVLVCVCDLPDEPMNVEPFERSRDLNTGCVGEFLSEMFVLKTADGELAACNGFEEFLVSSVEKIETLVRPIVLENGF